jgi:hypothetical protein
MGQAMGNAAVKLQLDPFVQTFCRRAQVVPFQENVCQ